MKNNKIIIHRGRSYIIIVPVVYEDGTAVAISSSEDVIRFSVRRQTEGPVVINKVMSYDNETGTASVELTPADTKDLQLGYYHYDIGVDFSDGSFFDLVEWSEFNLLPSASQHEEQD